MPRPARGTSLFLLVTAFFPGGAYSAVLVGCLAIVVSVFVVGAVVHVHQHRGQPSLGRTTGEAAPRPGPPAVRLPVSAGVGGCPTPLAPAGSGHGRGRGTNNAAQVAVTLHPELRQLAALRDGRWRFGRASRPPARPCRRGEFPNTVADARIRRLMLNLHTGLSVEDGPWTTRVTRGRIRRADVPDHYCRSSSSRISDPRILVGLVSSPWCTRQLRPGFFDDRYRAARQGTIARRYLASPTQPTRGRRSCRWPQLTGCVPGLWVPAATAVGDDQAPRSGFNVMQPRCCGHSVPLPAARSSLNHRVGMCAS
jgi:hypothetical protein